MKNLIKVVNPDVATKLSALGFSYIKEQIGKQDVFVFAMNDDLCKILNSKFSKSDFICENKLRF